LEQEPHTARARPTTAIRGEAEYKKIFSGDKDKQPLEMYGVIVRLLASVEHHFREIATAENQLHRNNLKFHVLMMVSWALNGGSKLPALRIVQLDPDKLSQEMLAAVTDWVFAEFDQAGAEDRNAKDKEFTKRLKDS
jgi:hypothetical protein